MSKFLLLFIVLVSNVALAQQSLFNVPSSEQTEKGRHFGQEQLNLLPSRNYENNFTYDYGISENVEIGFNVLGWSDLSKSEGGKSADYMFNSQYFLEMSEHWKVGVAGQLGVSQEGSLAAYGFINFRRTLFNEESFIVLGAFDANSAYLEEGHANWHLGVEYALNDKIDLIVDYINGNTSLSEGVAGFGYRFTDAWMLSAGSQFPAPHSGNDYGVVLELTYY